MLLGLLLLGGVLLFANLGNQYLWQDEAETAVLARHVLQTGYPKASDGVNRIFEPKGYGPHDLWIYHTWLQFYLAAVGLRLFGEHALAVRIPFALLGLLTVALTYALTRRLLGSRAHARLAAALLVSNVPFLLHMRQARYYALATCLASWLVWCYLDWREGKRGAAWRFALCAVLLFHANHGVWVPTVAGLFLHALVARPRPIRVRELAGVCAVIAALTLPSLVWIVGWAHAGAFDLEQVSRHAQFYVRVINKHLFPLALIGVVLVARGLLRRPMLASFTGRARSALILSGVVIGANLLFLLLPAQRYLRYVIHLVPWFALVGSLFFLDWVRRAPRLGTAVLGLALFTNVLQSPHVSIPLARLAGELTHDYDGPIEGIVTYLRRHARPGETAKIPYGDRPLIFYTGLRVEDMSRFQEETYPDWIIMRRDWIPEGFTERPYFQRIQARYARVTLDAPDLPWENRPDPGYHKYRTVTNAPPVELYRRADPAAGS